MPYSTRTLIEDQRPGKNRGTTSKSEGINMARAQMWIDSNDGHDIGFLVEFANVLRNSSRFYLSDRPPHTNQSHEPCAVGWCGTWNDIATHGHGVYQVVKRARNGRVLIREVTDRAQLDEFLGDVGYPGLL